MKIPTDGRATEALLALCNRDIRGIFCCSVCLLVCLSDNRSARVDGLKKTLLSSTVVRKLAVIKHLAAMRTLVFMHNILTLFLNRLSKYPGTYLGSFSWDSKYGLGG